MSLLNPKDKIGYIAPSSCLNDKDLAPSIEYFNSIGLEVVVANDIYSQYRYMAGTDIKRAQDINKMFEDDRIKAIFCTRGGAGALRLLPYLDYELISKKTKPIFGLSDSTVLQNALFAKTNNPSYTGFLPLYDINSSNINPTLKNNLEAIIFNNNHKIVSGTSLNQGQTSGIIVGGCLSVFLSLCGTPYFPDLTDKIILIEDDDEKTYRIDLMLNQLKLQKNFDKVKAIIFGSFTDSKIIDKEDGNIDDCINDFSKELNIPIIKNFQYGHIPNRYILPIGIKVDLVSTLNECYISW